MALCVLSSFAIILLDRGGLVAFFFFFFFFLGGGGGCVVDCMGVSLFDCTPLICDCFFSWSF